MNAERKIMNKGRNFHKLALTLCAVFVSSLIVFSAAMVAADEAWSPEKEIRTYMTDHYPWEEIEISNVQISGKIGEELPESIIVEKGPLGNAVFSFLFGNNEKISVRADIRAFGWVVKSKAPFKVKHILEDEDMYLEKIDIRKMPKNAVKDPAEITGKALKRSISANVPIREEMVEMSRVVSRGKSVVLLLSHNGMSIRAAGKTKETGYVGMPVKAVNLSSKKEVTGVLLDDKTVKVEL